MAAVADRADAAAAAAAALADLPSISLLITSMWVRLSAKILLRTVSLLLRAVSAGAAVSADRMAQEGTETMVPSDKRCLSRSAQMVNARVDMPVMLIISVFLNRL